MDNIPRVPEDDLYEDLDKSLDQNRAKSRKIKAMILVGVVVGLGMAHYFSYIQLPLDKLMSIPAPAPAPAPAPKVKVAPKPEPPKVEQTALPQEPDSPPAQEEAISPEQVDERLAALNKMNLIEEDISSHKEQTAPPVVKVQPSQTNKPDAEEPPKAPAIQPDNPPAPAEGNKGKAESSASPPDINKEESDTYAVQVVATTDAMSALEIRDKLAAQGRQPWIATSTTPHSSYRVEVGVFGTIKEAASLSVTMAEAGFENRAAYLSGGKMVTLVIGSFANREDGARLALKAKTAGFEAKVRLRSETKNLYMVRVGKYKSHKEAQDAMNAIRKSGFHPEGITK